MTQANIPASSYRDTAAAPHRSTSIRSSRIGTAWGAMLAGAVTAIAIQLLFTVLGTAIGVSVAEPGSGRPDAGGMSLAAGMWWLITGTISLVIGGAVLGWLWEVRTGITLHIHALTMWGVVALFGFFVIWSGVGMATEAVAPVAAIAATTGMDQQGLDAGLGQNTGTSTAPNPDRGAVTTFENRSTSREAVSNARTASWWSLIGLIIGIAASLIGAHLAASRDPVRREFVPAT